MGRHEEGPGLLKPARGLMIDLPETNAEELVVLVDDEDRPVGTALKREVHHSETPLHRAFSIFVFNSRRELLLQRRAFPKKTWPGVWSNSCCGHPLPGETRDDAARRRLKFELGLGDVRLVLALPDFRYRAEKDGIVENEICPVFIGFTEEEPTPNPDEVDSIKWVDWDEFAASIDDPATAISPWAILEAGELIRTKAVERAFGEYGLL